LLFNGSPPVPSPLSIRFKRNCCGGYRPNMKYDRSIMRSKSEMLFELLNKKLNINIKLKLIRRKSKILVDFFIKKK